MTVYFIGAGPGAADLITLRGQRLIERCPVCLYAGSLVPAEIVAAAPAGRIGPRHRAHASRRDHRRDGRRPCAGRGRRPRPLRRSLDLWRRRRTDAPPRRARHCLRSRPRRARLRRRRRAPRHRADAARNQRRPSSSPAPPARPRPCRRAKASKCSAQSGATLAIHLTIRNLAYVEQALTPHYGADCPAIIIYRATWPDEEIIVTTLSEMRARVREEKITRTALIFVGHVFGDEHVSATAALRPGLRPCAAQCRQEEVSVRWRASEAPRSPHPASPTSTAGGRCRPLHHDHFRAAAARAATELRRRLLAARILGDEMGDLPRAEQRPLIIERERRMALEQPRVRRQVLSPAARSAAPAVGNRRARAASPARHGRWSPARVAPLGSASAASVDMWRHVASLHPRAPPRPGRMKRTSGTPVCCAAVTALIEISPA